LNTRIAVRFQYLLKMRESDEPDDECLAYLFPTGAQEMSFRPLDLYAISGGILFLCTCLLCACIVFIVEHVVCRLCRRDTSTTGDGSSVKAKFERFVHTLDADDLSADDRKCIEEIYNSLPD
jgi:hypothetical protein